MSKHKPKKIVWVDGVPHRWRRGKLVPIPRRWLYRVTTRETIRQRPSKLPRKVRMGIDLGGSRSNPRNRCSRHCGLQRAVERADRRAERKDPSEMTPPCGEKLPSGAGVTHPLGRAKERRNRMNSGKHGAPGPTGLFPKGKMNEDDRGELAVKVAAGLSPENGEPVVALEFGTSLSWLALYPEQVDAICAGLQRAKQEALELKRLADEVGAEVNKVR